MSGNYKYMQVKVVAVRPTFQGQSISQELWNKMATSGVQISDGLGLERVELTKDLKFGARSWKQAEAKCAEAIEKWVTHFRGVKQAEDANWVVDAVFVRL